MAQFNINIAKTHFSELIQKALLGEEVIIAKDSKPIVKLVALQTPKQRRQLGLAKGMVTIAPDFDEPLEDFKDYE